MAKPQPGCVICPNPQCKYDGTVQTASVCEKCGQPIKKQPRMAKVKVSNVGEENFDFLLQEKPKEPTPATKICSNCKKENYHQVTFCEYCGWNFVSGEMPKVKEKPKPKPYESVQFSGHGINLYEAPQGSIVTVIGAPWLKVKVVDPGTYNMDSYVEQDGKRVYWSSVTRVMIGM